ncbi:MAG: hypothetical protein WAK96_00250, partial [Desulfobaccales bacterium]
DTLRKCMAFFLNSAKSAGINLSTYIKKVPSSRTGPAKPRRKEAAISKTKSSPSEETKSPHKDQPPQQSGDSWDNALLSKFPTFDSAWPDDVKSKWFDDFKELMALRKKG